jgi:hypothetical protein
VIAMPNPDTGEGFDAPLPALAYAAAPELHREMHAVLALGAERDGRRAVHLRLREGLRSRARLPRRQPPHSDPDAGRTDRMSAQPVHQPAPPPSPAAAAKLRERIVQHERARAWLPAFERDWTHALESSKQTYDLTPLHEVVREWSGRLDTAPAVAAFFAGGMDTCDGVALEDVIGTRG